MEVLNGHISPETAYVVDSYPYGRLRCQIRYWVETKKNFGMRFVSQTENPKTKKWNKPKCGVYYPVIVMYKETEEDDNPGYVHGAGISYYTDFDKLVAFYERFKAVEGPAKDHLENLIRQHKENKDGILVKI